MVGRIIYRLSNPKSYENETVIAMYWQSQYFLVVAIDRIFHDIDDYHVKYKTKVSHGRLSKNLGLELIP